MALKVTKINEQITQIEKLKQEKEEIRTELDREILLNEQLNDKIEDFGQMAEDY